MKRYTRFFENDVWQNLRNKYKKLNIVLDIYEGNNKSILSMIKIPKELRNQGYAKQAMIEICNIADKNNLTVTLTPTNEFGSNKSKLINFYKKFGFIENKGKNKNYQINYSMFRLPNN